MYDPTKGTFLTPDTYRTGPPTANPSVGIDPLTANSYSYVNGDPVNLDDPTGHGVACDDGGNCGNGYDAQVHEGLSPSSPQGQAAAGQQRAIEERQAPEQPEEKPSGPGSVTGTSTGTLTLACSGWGIFLISPVKCTWTTQVNPCNDKWACHEVAWAWYAEAKIDGSTVYVCTQNCGALLPSPPQALQMGAGDEEIEALAEDLLGTSSDESTAEAVAALGGTIEPATGTASGVIDAVQAEANDLVNLASDAHTAHIIGRHTLPGGTGSLFPGDWSSDEIMNAISDIATDPQYDWQQTSGIPGSLYTRAGGASRFAVDGTYNGLTIRVVIEPAGEGIITGYPVGSS
jgi:hypothetical protein